MRVSLKNKLVLLIMFTGTAVLMIIIGVYVAINVSTIKESTLEDTKVLASIIAKNNQASLLFKDSLAAKESIYSLIADKEIEHVSIYDKDGNLFVEHYFSGSPKQKNEANTLSVSHDVLFEGEKIGTLNIAKNLQEVDTQINRALITGVVVFVLALVVTYMLTIILQKLITTPILNLSKKTASIAKKGDFSTIIKNKRKDEIGDLVTSFNNLLKVIETQKSELVIAKDHAEHSSKAKEQFLANMSHEIRTPINGIDGMCKLLDGTNLSEEQKEYLNAIESSSENLLVIINDILDISKIEAGKLTLEKIGFKIRDCINQNIKTNYYKAEEKDILLLSEIEENIDEILMGDTTRLTQIITNLVSNAIKFTSEGFVKVKLSLDQKTEQTNTIKFEVLDTGIGISEDKLQVIFESFSQEDESTTRKFGGTGLGLSICKQLVELMGGTLGVKSKKGEGTIFHFTLDLAVGDSTDLPQKTKSSSNVETLTNKSVLLVEDNEINQFLAVTILKKWKINVDVAENGQIALDKLKESNYDVILMDMQMPVMGGIEATKIIREDLKLDTPIIALTANAIKGDEIKCLEAGMNDYVSKPFEHSDLFNKILKAINDGKQIV